MEIVHIDISYITLKPQAKLVYFFIMHWKMNVQTLFYNAGFTSKLKQPRLRIIILELLEFRMIMNCYPW